MIDLIHNFMQHEGTPINRTSFEIMNYLQSQGYSFRQSCGILGRAVGKGFIRCVYEDKHTKIYI